MTVLTCLFKTQIEKKTYKHKCFKCENVLNNKKLRKNQNCLGFLFNISENFVQGTDSWKLLTLNFRVFIPCQKDPARE